MEPSLSAVCAGRSHVSRMHLIFNIPLPVPSVVVARGKSLNYQMITIVKIVKIPNSAESSLSCFLAGSVLYPCKIVCILQMIDGFSWNSSKKRKQITRFWRIAKFCRGEVRAMTRVESSHLSNLLRTGRVESKPAWARAGRDDGNVESPKLVSEAFARYAAFHGQKGPLRSEWRRRPLLVDELFIAYAGNRLRLR